MSTLQTRIDAFTEAVKIAEADAKRAGEAMASDCSALAVFSLF